MTKRIIKYNYERLSIIMEETVKSRCVFSPF